MALDFKPQLQNLSRSELEGITSFSNMDKISELIENNPELKSLAAKKEQVINQTKTQAQQNLARQPELENLQAQLQMEKEKFTELKSQHDQLVAQLASNSSELSLDSAKMKLESAQISAQSTCDELCEQFYDEEALKPREFVNQFLKAKFLVHSRKIKIEEINNKINILDNERRVRNTASQQPYPNSPYGGMSYANRPAPARPAPNVPMGGYTAYGAYGGQ